MGSTCWPNSSRTPSSTARPCRRAFTARVVLEELNATGRVITPARFAHLVAADLRPLLCARRAPVTATETNPAPRRVIRVTPAPVRPATTPPVASPVPRLINTA
jgi:hypothetical protein